jgi:protoporphyrinogen oxidase
MTTSPERWAILGGGILGMTLAHRLRQRGKPVTLFEAAGYLGGLAAPWQLGDVTWDRHYHVTLLSDTHLRGLLAELGLDRDLSWVETKTGFYTDGHLYSMSNTLEFLRFPPLGLLDKLRLGATIFYASKIKNWRRLEAIPVAEWLERWSGRRTCERIWLPLLRAKLGDNYRSASAAFIWAIIARMYAARRTGLKKEMFGYVKGGYSRILQRFGEVLVNSGVSVRLGHAVQSVDPVAGEVRVAFANGHQELFDRVVLTVPAPVAARVCSGLSDDERQRLTSIQYQGIVCASLLLKQPLAGYYVTNITDSWVPFTAVIEMSALVDRAAFGGHALVYLPKYVPPEDPIFALSDAEIESRCLAALEKMYPHFRQSDVVQLRVSRVRHVLPISTLHYSTKLPPMQSSVPGVFLVNSCHIVNGTLNVNETVQLAERALGVLLSAAAPAQRLAVGPPA